MIMPNKETKNGTKSVKNSKNKSNKKVDVNLEELDDEVEIVKPEEFDPEEQEIAQLLTKPQKPKKVEKHDIDNWLIDRELESAENGDDWF